MTALNVIFWVLVVLLAVAFFAPAAYVPARGNGFIELALFVVIGLKSFRTSLS